MTQTLERTHRTDATDAGETARARRLTSVAVAAWVLVAIHAFSLGFQLTNSEEAQYDTATAGPLSVAAGVAMVALLAGATVRRLGRLPRAAVVAAFVALAALGLGEVWAVLRTLMRPDF